MLMIFWGRADLREAPKTPSPRARSMVLVGLRECFTSSYHSILPFLGQLLPFVSSVAAFFDFFLSFEECVSDIIVGRGSKDGGVSTADTVADGGPDADEEGDGDFKP